VSAEAKIEGDTVVVTSAEVSAPAAVRYAWDNYPEGCNLYNAAGLPAAPFRTDRWPYEY
jgi:sialate O-acetylesterase